MLFHKQIYEKEYDQEIPGTRLEMVVIKNDSKKNFDIFCIFELLRSFQNQ